MPPFDPKQALDLLGRARKVVRLREVQGERAASALRALRRAGFEAFELDPPGAAAGSSRLFREEPFLLAGAGGAVTPEEVREAAREGACWVTVSRPGKALVETGKEEGILLSVRVRERREVEEALELGASCLLLAPPLSLVPERAGALVSELRRKGLFPALEGPWGLPLPPAAAFHVVTAGLFPRSLLGEGRFREIENLARLAREG